MKGLITLGKDVLNKFEKSSVVYKLICKKCKVSYVGQTGRLLNTRVEEHKKNLRRKCNYHYVLSVPWRKVYVPMEVDRRHNFFSFFIQNFSLEEGQGVPTPAKSC